MELMIQTKDSNLGILPNDWDVKTLGEIGECLIGLTYKPTNIKESGTLVLRSSNIIGNTLSLNDTVYVNAEIPERIRIKNGDILICVRNGSRALIGKTALLDSRVEGETFGAFMSVFRTKDSLYIFHQLQSNLVKRQIEENIGATINQITNGNLNSFRIPYPTRADERNKIGLALSDVDDLLAKLDQLIAKKFDIKKGAMQELLTGKRRLEGFSNPWTTHVFGDLALRRTERIAPKSNGASDYCIELEHLEPGSGQIIGYTNTSRSSSLKTVFQPGDVLFGKLRAYLRKFALTARPGVCSTEIWALAAKEGLIRPDFLLQTVTRDDFIENASEAYGTHMPRSDWGTVSKFEVGLPPLEEQKAIAAVLGDMDADIKCLKEKRNKLLHIKQGMMQQLLTGKIRLV